MVTMGRVIEHGKFLDIMQKYLNIISVISQNTLGGGVLLLAPFTDGKTEAQGIN